MWAVLTAVLGVIVRGIVEPFLNWWTTYQAGRTAGRLRQSEAARKQEQAINEALDTLRDWSAGEFEIGPDGRVRRKPREP